VTVQGWNYDFTANGKPQNGGSATFSSQDAAASGGPLVGLTLSGRVNASTGLYYPKTTAFDPADPYRGSASVSFDAPVVGTTGIPTYTTSASRLKVQCDVDSEGNPTASVQAAATVPTGLPSPVPAGHTVVLKSADLKDQRDVKVVYNEQTRLADGRLQVTGMHVVFDVPEQVGPLGNPIAGSGAVQGDLRLGTITCGKVTNAPEEAVPVAPASVAGGVLGLAALAGSAAVLRRRNR